MAFSRPTLSELIDRITQDLMSRLSLSSPILRGPWPMCSRASWRARRTCCRASRVSGQAVVPRPVGRRLSRPAGWAVRPDAHPGGVCDGNVTATGTNGTVIPIGTVLVRADGAEFATTAEATIAAGTATLAVEASVAGQDGNTDAASPLTFQSPIAGVNSAAVVATGGLSGGADEETDSALADRLIERMQSRRTAATRRTMWRGRKRSRASRAHGATRWRAARARSSCGSFGTMTLRSFLTRASRDGAGVH
jgi:uncharacterized phage protein gp47/JayE